MATWGTSQLQNALFTTRPFPWPTHASGLLFSTPARSPFVYPELFALTGPNVPDYRGMFLRGYGSQTHSQVNGSTVGVTATTHASGALGAVQGDAIRNIARTPGEDSSGLTAFQIQMRRDHARNIGPFTTSVYNDNYAWQSYGGAPNHNFEDLGFDASLVVPTAPEIRPANTAVRYLIRAKP